MCKTPKEWEQLKSIPETEAALQMAVEIGKSFPSAWSSAGEGLSQLSQHRESSVFQHLTPCYLRQIPYFAQWQDRPWVSPEEFSFKIK